MIVQSRCTSVCQTCRGKSATWEKWTLELLDLDEVETISMECNIYFATTALSKFKKHELHHMSGSLDFLKPFYICSWIISWLDCLLKYTCRGAFIFFRCRSWWHILMNLLQYLWYDPTEVIWLQRQIVITLDFLLFLLFYTINPDTKNNTADTAIDLLKCTIRPTIVTIVFEL